jgi:adhesin/invasin
VNTGVTSTGTYTATSACLGTVTLTDSATNKYAVSLSIFGPAAGNFVLTASNAQAVFSGNGRTAFVNPGQSVDNAASFVAAATPAGSVFTVFGSNLATAVSQPSVIPLPTTVLTTTLSVNGELAPMFYVSPTQINAQMPVDIQPGLATVIVKNGTSTSNAVAVVVPATGTPGIITYSGGTRAVVLDASQSRVLNSPTAPAKVGDVMEVYFIGGGPATTTAPLVTGAPTPGTSAPITGTYSITVNGKDAAASYIGLTPGSIGLYQADFKIPQVAAGDHPLVITIAGQASNRPLITIGN